MTEAEYLEAEKLATDRHEYVDGKVFRMPDANRQHSRIVMNLLGLLHAAAHRSHCDVFFTQVKLRVAKHNAFYYPDLMVGCAPDDADDYYLEKPCLLVEVASESTIRKDYLEKSLAYQSIPSLRAYLIVAQDKLQVDMLIRTEESDWQLRQFDRAEDELVLPCLDRVLSVAEIYRQVLAE